MGWLPPDLQKLEDAYTDPRLVEMQHAAIEINDYLECNDSLSSEDVNHLLEAYSEKYAGFIDQEVSLVDNYWRHETDSVEPVQNSLISKNGFYGGLTVEPTIMPNGKISNTLRHIIKVSKNDDASKNYITHAIDTPLNFPLVVSEEKITALMNRIKPLVDEVDEAIAGSKDLDMIIKQLKEIDYETNTPDSIWQATYMLLAQHINKLTQIGGRAAYDTQLIGATIQQGVKQRIAAYGTYTLVQPDFVFFKDKEHNTALGLRGNLHDHNAIPFGPRVSDRTIPISSVKHITKLEQ